MRGSDEDNCHHSKLPAPEPDAVMVQFGGFFYLKKLRLWEILYNEYLVSRRVDCKNNSAIYLSNNFYFLLDA